MARGINKVILVGNVGADPDIKYLPSGSPVANVSLATSKSWKDKNSGEQHDKTEWHRVVLFNRLAEVVGEYVRKGSQLYIEGELRTTKWEKDGVTRYTTDVVANEMQMLGGGRAPSEAKTHPNQGQHWSATPPDFDDEVPF